MNAAASKLACELHTPLSRHKHYAHVIDDFDIIFDLSRTAWCMKQKNINKSK